MTWWRESTIPNTDELLEIIDSLVFHCPSSYVTKIRDGSYSDGKEKYKITYVPVSGRNCSFRQRGIDKTLLHTALAQVRKPMLQHGTFHVLQCKESVTEKVSSIISNSSLSDPYFEMAVFHKISNLSDVEAYYYYVRNAFAHGAFEIIGNSPSNIYILESKRNDTVKAQIRLKGSTLLCHAHLARLKSSEIKKMQR